MAWDWGRGALWVGAEMASGVGGYEGCFDTWGTGLGYDVDSVTRVERPMFWSAAVVSDVWF